jgi:hypothetical protein
MNTTIEGLDQQLDREKRAVSYDMYDMTVKQLVEMVSAKEINIAPEYQRHFVWDDARESELIESIYLGIPVPSLYMAANKDGTWEVVDGVQRLSTLVHFVGNKSDLPSIKKAKALTISELKKLTALNNKNFAALPKSLQLNFLLRPIRVTTLNDKSDIAVRFDLFERLNTGGVRLHPQEIRNCVFRGTFRDLLKELASDANFQKVVKLADNEQRSAVMEECVLRFFAYSENYKKFDHSVIDFLNDYMISKSQSSVSPNQIASFRRTMAKLAAALPSGITRENRKITPINLFEGVAVGTALANPKNIDGKKLLKLMSSDELKKFTTAATNSKTMVVGRIELVRNSFG